MKISYLVPLCIQIKIFNFKIFLRYWPSFLFIRAPVTVGHCCSSNLHNDCLIIAKIRIVLSGSAGSQSDTVWYSFITKSCKSCGDFCRICILFSLVSFPTMATILYVAVQYKGCDRCFKTSSILYNSSTRFIYLYWNSN